MKNFLITITSLFLLIACSDSEPIASGPEIGNEITKAESHAIRWFDGTVEEAFTNAKNAGKPLFLYWGAVWCPPCQEIKHTVFKSRRFIQQTESFVPVYLDGDTSTAQQLGEKFGVKGYPTMIVFNSKGTEITRIPGGIDVSIYNDILALSQEAISPTAELVLRIIDAPDTIDEKELKQLAFYSWGQDNSALPQNYSPDIFLTMAQMSNDPVSSARLYMQYLHELAGAHEKERLNETDAATITPITGAYSKVASILESDALTLACWDSLAYYSVDLLPHIAPEEDQAELIALWQSRMLDLSKQESLSTAEQLAGLIPMLEFYFLDGESIELNTANRAIVLAATQSADQATENSSARQSVVSQINYVLQTAHLVSEAKQLLLSELDRSKSPYYFMSSLAALAEKQDKIEESITWYKKAYDNSVGAATRFQWGANYIAALIRLQPEREEHILVTSSALLEEIEGSSEVFAGRNFRVLKRLDQNLDEWGAEKSAPTLAKFRDIIGDRCQQQLAGSSEAENCATLI